MASYACPRCGFSTKYKRCMLRHLYERKNVCIPRCKDITLTDQIKNDIINFPEPGNTTEPLQTQNPNIKMLNFDELVKEVVGLRKELKNLKESVEPIIKRGNSGTSQNTYIVQNISNVNSKTFSITNNIFENTGFETQARKELTRLQLKELACKDIDSDENLELLFSVIIDAIFPAGKQALLLHDRPSNKFVQVLHEGGLYRSISKDQAFDGVFKKYHEALSALLYEIDLSQIQAMPWIDEDHVPLSNLKVDNKDKAQKVCRSVEGALITGTKHCSKQGYVQRNIT